MAATYSPTTQCSTIGDAVSRCCPRPSAAPLSAPLSPAPARRRRAQPTPRMAHTAPHSATPPPMRHTRGGKRRLFLPGQKRYGLSQKRNIGLSIFTTFLGGGRSFQFNGRTLRVFLFFERPQGARVIRVRGLRGYWIRGYWIRGCAGIALDLMTGGEFKMVFDDTEIKMGVAYEGEFRLGLYALVSV